MNDGVLTIVFYILAVVAVGSALMVLFVRNLFHAALFLILSFLAVSGVFVLLHADFLAAVQVLLYAGAIAILIIFGVMLTEHMGRVPFRMVSFNVGAALLTCGLIAAALILGLRIYPWPEAIATTEPTSARIGELFLTDYLLPFEVASVLLLVVLVGAVAVARKEVKDE